MRKIKKILLILICITMTTLMFTGCSKEDEKTKLKVAEVTHSVFYAPQYVALNEGFFEEEGLDVELIAAQGADKTMAALISGEVQIGFMGPEASIYVHNQQSKDYAINFAQVTKRDGSFLVGREKEEDFKFENLKGKEVIGGRKGGMPEMTLEYVIKNNGLNIGKNTNKGEVNVRTDIQFNVMSGAFVAGQGDYVALFEPVATALEKDNKAHIVASIGEESGEIPYTAYCATNTYINKNPEIIQKFTNAIYKGQLYIQNKSSEEIAKSIAPFFADIKMEDLIVVVDRYKSIDAWCENPILKEDSLNRLMDVMELAKELDKKAPYDKIVTTKFAEEAIKNIK
ncbi:ABC transporter substrate-binding protein [Clostridium tetani]|uniref:ABC transporter substrate-binding protein n=1 Tax=Clostridium tetani TaxID=1513 RepID=UPI00100AC44E|nr:ABC transporter substrate-binding protein [Clostridium tetani]RXI47803.1 ABC transporter substrate-binding protein [Clostridium tetani]RXM61119.1 ABC transporter substrate-binding protein [Clostridium tetani]RXM69645.1 ABC transporter substrate-binding protein [Clostridium tetani]